VESKSLFEGKWTALYDLLFYLMLCSLSLTFTTIPSHAGWVERIAIHPKASWASILWNPSRRSRVHRILLRLVLLCRFRLEILGNDRLKLET